MDEETKQRCQELTAFATRAVDELSKMAHYPTYKMFFLRTFRIDITDEDKRKALLCKIAGG